jgi:hypothetical protein
MRIRPYLLRIIGCALGIPIGALIASWAWNSLSGELRLRSEGVPIKASVRDWRVLDTRYGTDYEVRYSFTVANRPEEFTFCDPPPIERPNLWASLPQPVWEESRHTRLVDVLFLPDEPRTNRPAQLAGDQLGDLITGVLVCGGLAIGCAVVLAVGYWQYRRCKQDPECRAKAYWLFRVERCSLPVESSSIRTTDVTGSRGIV